MKSLTRIWVIVLVGSITAGVGALDVSIDPPEVDFKGALAGQNTAQLNSELENLANEFEQQLQNDELARFSDQPLLTQGFANAGAAAAHLGTQRAFSDYRMFALVVGTGAGVAAVDVDPSVVEDAGTSVEDDGDVYLGAAVQPITVSLGINLSRIIPRTRLDVKVGYADIAQGTLADEVGFNSLSAGFGINYQLLRSRQLPLGFLRWRGLTVAGGVIYQRNEVQLEVDLSDDGGFGSDPLTFGDVGFSDGDLVFLTDVDSNTPIGTFNVSPVLNATIESDTYSVPLELTTGLRILWLLDVNFGAGVDLVFGSSDVTLGATAETAFVPSPEAQSLIDSTPGSAVVTTSTSDGPDFVRPRITGGVGVNLGPVKLDVPVMLFFDSEGSTVMAGVNVGIVF